MVVVLLPVTPMAPPGGAAEVRAHGWTDGWREREALFTAARLEASCTSSWADSGVAAPWAPGRSSRARLPTAQCTLAGPSVQPQEPSLLLPSGLWVSRPQPRGAFSVSGVLLSSCGMGHSGFHPPRHLRRGKTNSPGHPAPPGMALCRAVCHSGCCLCGLPLQGSAQPLPGAQLPAVRAQLLRGVGLSSDLQVLGLQG